MVTRRGKGGHALYIQLLARPKNIAWQDIALLNERVGAGSIINLTFVSGPLVRFRWGIKELYTGSDHEVNKVEIGKRQHDSRETTQQGLLTGHHECREFRRRSPQSDGRGGRGRRSH